MTSNLDRGLSCTLRIFVAVTLPAPHRCIPARRTAITHPGGFWGGGTGGALATHRVPTGSSGSGYPGSYRIPAGIRSIPAAAPFLPPARAKETRGAAKEEGKEEEEKKKKNHVETQPR